MKRFVTFITLLLGIIMSANANSAADMMLIRAIQDDNFREAKYWLEHGANANCTSDEGSPVLSMAMEADFNRHHSLDKFDNSVPFTELLLQKGANPNSNISLLPLISAVLKLGDYRLCNVLLKYGANPRIIEPYKEVNMNAIDYARHLGYTRVSNLLANPKSYSNEYTVFELNYLIKISLNNQKYDETIKYCNQFYTKLPQELSSRYNGWLTKTHIYCYHESALFRKSLIASRNHDYKDAERLLLEAIQYAEERQKAGDTDDLGVDLSQALRNVRNQVQDNPAAVLDDLVFLLQQGQKDTTTVYYLIAAANYLRSISDQEGSYNCLAMAFEWTKEDPQLRKQLSKDIYLSLLSNCTSIYFKNAPRPIMSEEDLSNATNYINRNFGAQSIQALQYSVSKISYYAYYSGVDKAINYANSTISNIEQNLYSSRFNAQEKEFTKELYVLCHLYLSGLYENKYNHGKFYFNTSGKTPSYEELLAYNTLKKILDDARFNKKLNIGVYTSFLSQCHRLNKLDQIWKYVPTYYSLNHQQIDDALATLSEEEALYWWGESKPFFYDFDIIIATNQYVYPSYIPGEIYNNELFKKDLLLRTNKRIQQYLADSKDPTIIHLYESVIRQKTLLWQMQLAKKVEDHAIDSLKQSILSKERLLALESNAYAQHMQEKEVSWEDIRSKLRPNEVAIEFINNGGVDQYWALILRKEYSEPKLIYLKDFIRYSPADIKSQMDFWKKYGEPVGIEPPQFLQFNGDAGEVYKYGKDENGTKLYEALWTPLTQYIKEGDRVYFAPSGILLQLSVEALPVDNKTVLSDHYKLIRLSSTKEIAEPHTPHPKKDAVLYGNIQYGIDDVDVFIAESEKYQNRSFEEETIEISDENRANVKPLFGTKIEVTDISKLLSKAHFKFKVLESYNANEESFKALSGNSPQILHIATHGFYWDNDRATTEPFITRTTAQGATMVDPLSRCGLLFAGANIAYSGHGSSLPQGVEDGILTAKEISLIDLSNTQLLVLSACETGLGELTDAGVFGLQRAFKQAGVGTIIMSLWKVNDNATQMMMSKFYEFWLSGQDKRTAFYNAQKEIRKNPKTKSPYYWAGFIMLD